MNFFILVLCGLALTSESFRFEKLPQNLPKGPVIVNVHPPLFGQWPRQRRESNDEDADDIHEGDSHALERRLTDLQEAVDEIHKRQTTVYGDLKHDTKSGVTFGHGGVSHLLGNGKTSLGGRLDFDSLGGRKYTGTIDHTFNGGKSSLGASLSRDSFGRTNVGASLDHSFWKGNGKFGLNVNHDSHSGTSFGLGGSLRFKKRNEELMRDKKQTKVFGDFDSHNGRITSGNAGVDSLFNDGRTKIHGNYHYQPGSHRFGGGFSHTFGKRHADMMKRHALKRRLADLEAVLEDIHKRQTTLHGNVQHGNRGTKGTLGLKHSFDNGGSAGVQVDHDFHSGETTWGGGISFPLGKRLVQSQVEE